MEEGNQGNAQFLHQQHQQKIFLARHRQLQQQQRHHCLNPIRHQEHSLPLEADSPETASVMLLSSSSSNEGIHLHFPMGLRALYLNNFVKQPQPQLKPAVPPPLSSSSAAGGLTESEMAQMDAASICNPDFRRPFSSIEDAVIRLLPYHVVADNEPEEDHGCSTGETLSGFDNQWDHNTEIKMAEITSLFHKQVMAFNILSQKRKLGEFRSEERLMIEEALLQEERQAVLQMKAEMEAREKAKLLALTSNTQLLLAQAEQARGGMQAIGNGKGISAFEVMGNDRFTSQCQGFRQASGSSSDVMIQEWENAVLWKRKEPSEGFISYDQEFYDLNLR